MQPFVITPLDILHEAEIGVILSVGAWMLMFPVRTIFKKATDVLNKFETKLTNVETELSAQRTNCLTTLQSQGTEQIKLLEKAVSTLEAIHISQAEMSGYIKANHEKSA